MSSFYPNGTLDRHSLADLMSRQVAPASAEAADLVSTAAAEWLARWASGTAGSDIEDWAHPASALTCEEFLAPHELAALCDHVLAHQSDFFAGTLVSHDTDGVFVDRDFRAAETLFDLGPFQALFSDRINYYLPFVCDRLGFAPLDRHWFEFQLAAIPDGGFFRRHDDNSHAETRTRRLTCVFYFYCSPTPPGGGELRFSPRGRWRGPQSFRPLANRMIFFDSSIPHEVLPVRAASDRFDAARFTVNGWVHQDRD